MVGRPGSPRFSSSLLLLLDWTGRDGDVSPQLVGLQDALGPGGVVGGNRSSE